MTITAAIVLFAIIWWTVFFVLPVRFKSQSEAGSVVPGIAAIGARSDHAEAEGLDHHRHYSGAVRDPVSDHHLGKIGIADLDIFILRASHP